MPPRLLILSASVGAGHLRAAQAVELAAGKLLPKATVKNLDILTLTNPAFRRVYGQAYLDLVNKVPHVLGYFYDRLDRAPSPARKSDRLRLAVEKFNLRPFVKFLESQRWDVIINTHFLPAEIIASLKRRGRFATPQATVTTDFETHRLWVNQPCEQYFTATDEGAMNLHHWGVPLENILCTGIPIHPVFSERKSRAACLKRQGLAGKTPVVLLLAGGFGVGPIERIFEAICDINQPLEIVVVCGRNEALRKRLDAAARPSRHRTKVLGFTDQIDELMAAADVVVTKPGGLTTSEALARGAAIAVINPIPGQESRNSDFLLENGAAIKINNIATLPFKLGVLLGDRERLATLKKNAKALGRPRAAFDIITHLMTQLAPRLGK